jgi:hypothetical protein
MESLRLPAKAKSPAALRLEWAIRWQISPFPEAPKVIHLVWPTRPATAKLTVSLSTSGGWSDEAKVSDAARLAAGAMESKTAVSTSSFFSSVLVRGSEFR